MEREDDSSVEADAITGGPTPQNLEKIERSFRTQLEAATASENHEALQRLRSTMFGPKGQMTMMLREVGRLPPEMRREAGQSANRLKVALEGALVEVLEAFASRARELALRSARADTTLPGRHLGYRGAAHPVSRLIEEISDIFQRMGFQVASGPEVELDAFNFEALNFPPDHPARDMQDTFFVAPPAGGAPDGSRLLRTHTSPVQIRAMRAQGAPIRIIAPGRVYRCDSDATHSPMFHQVEGLMVDEGVSMAHLRGVLQSFVNAFFGERAMRFRPSFFPFVEPGAEVDIQCVFCEGTGRRQDAPCRVCKATGWLEILGAGMVHPKVLANCGVDWERFTGFAFGMGVDRVAMLRWGVDDLAHLFRSDVRFLRQI
ncbi:MAG: phenylalanine--tRNA ligase subunit alpha [Deltaproteobacteria bacterium]|nr:phenylalanine--tRNA ligase subunit alpha [Deltaproteobacteria bacterium]